MRNKEVRRRNLDLFSSESGLTASSSDFAWPDSSRFPLNVDGRCVADIVLDDLKSGIARLIVTGYAGLDQLIDFVADIDTEHPIRVLFGWEPFPSRKATFELEGHDFPQEVETYWLERSISLRLSAKIVRCIEKIQKNQLDTRFLREARRKLHAKIYVTENAATLGSSNFTKPGLFGQLEANARFTAVGDKARHRDLQQIAENYWRKGRPYNEKLLDLLHKLLRIVQWREALARACAELLEGEWARAYLKREYLPVEGQLWPSQRQGIAQALYVLTRHGSVLVADAAGSGKTRLGVNLIGAVADHNIRIGRLRRGKSVMICPPLVAQAWETECNHASVPLDIYSHGVLSHEKSNRHSLTIEALKRAQILSIDEGHNFLTINSARTRHILRNMADYVLMFTATPLNRSVIDLLRIADILGADNLEPSTVAMFRKLLISRRPTRSLEPTELDTLRREIRKFTVRRTRSLLNHLISREPEEYRDADGRLCRFPDHRAEVYLLNESVADRDLAGRVRALSDQLRGVANFRKPIEKPEALREVSEESYLQGRLRSAPRIARYLVMKSLRSSRAALAEHLVGTKQAVSDFEVRNFSKSSLTGNVIATLRRIEGIVPKNKLRIPLPDWLTEPAKHAEACQHDAAIYEQIYQLTKQISSGREAEKAKLCVQVAGMGLPLLAFDSRPITLAVIRQHIKDIAADAQVIVATGDAGSDRDKALEVFARGSTADNVIGLCSDSLSEGVNLQRAAALIHLDMPSVVRLAEQRVGRIDRLDSPHTVVSAYWPDDAEEFALSSDERFVERLETVDALLGANLILPEAMQADRRPVRAREIIQGFDEEKKFGSWDGIQDAFEPVRSLISGQKPLISEALYDYYRKVVARIITRVSVVRSMRPWAFFCLAGGEFGAPRWVFMSGLDEEPLTDLDKICTNLRERLTGEVRDVALDEAASRLLERFLGRLADAERELLPRKKRRALEELDHFLEEMLRRARISQNQESVDKLHALRRALNSPESTIQPDLDEVAARWLDLIRPVWYECLKQPKRKRPLLLKDIRPHLLKDADGICRKLFDRFSEIPILQSPDERVAACILGVPDDHAV